MGRIVGRIQIDRDALDLAPQAPAVPINDCLGQCHPHPVERAGIQCILEPRERRLRGQLLATDRVATTEQLLDRVTAQSARIVPIRVAARDGIQALAHQLTDRMLNLVRLAPIIDSADQRLGQAESTIARLQQDRTAIGAAVLLVKLCHHRPAEQIGKQDSLSCAIAVHAKAS